MVTLEQARAEHPQFVLTSNDFRKSRLKKSSGARISREVANLRNKTTFNQELARINSQKSTIKSSGGITNIRNLTNQAGNRIQTTTTQIDQLRNGFRFKARVFEVKNLDTGETTIKTFEKDRGSSRVRQTGGVRFKEEKKEVGGESAKEKEKRLLQKAEDKLKTTSEKLKIRRTIARARVISEREKQKKKFAKDKKITLFGFNKERVKAEASSVGLALAQVGVTNLRGAVFIADVSTSAEARKEIKDVVKLIATDKESRQLAGAVIKAELNTFANIIKTNPSEAVALIGGEIIIMRGTGTALRIVAKVSKKILKKTTTIAGKTVTNSALLRGALKGVGRTFITIKKGGKVLVNSGKKVLKRTSRSLDKSTKKIITKIEKEIGEKLTDAEKIILARTIKKSLTYSAQRKRIISDLKRILRKEKDTVRINRLKKKLGFQDPKGLKARRGGVISKAKKRFAKAKKEKSGKIKRSSKKKKDGKIKKGKHKTIGKIRKEKILDRLVLKEFLKARRKPKLKGITKESLIRNVRKKTTMKITRKEFEESFKRVLIEVRRRGLPTIKQPSLIKGGRIPVKKKKVKLKNNRKIPKKKGQQLDRLKVIFKKDMKKLLINNRKKKVKKPSKFVKTKKKGRIPIDEIRDRRRLLAKLSKSEIKVEQIIQKITKRYVGSRTPKQKLKDIARLKRKVRELKNVRTSKPTTKFILKTIKQTVPFVKRETIKIKAGGRRLLLLRKAKTKPIKIKKSIKIKRKPKVKKIKRIKIRGVRGIISISVALASLRGIANAFRKANTVAQKKAVDQAVDQLKGKVTASIQSKAVAQAEQEKYRRIMRNLNKFKFRRVRIPKPRPKFGKKQIVKKGVTKIQGYNVFVKSRGKWKKANRLPLSKKGALDRGAYVVDHSTSASYKITPLTRIKKKGKITAKERGARKKAKLREFKIKKKRKITTPRRFIERKGRPRINTRGEKRGLSASRILKGLRRKPIKRRKTTRRRIRRK